MPEQAEETVIRNLIEALGRLHDDLDRMELWTAALGCLRHPIPDYQPGDQNLLRSAPRRQSRRPAR